MRRSFGQKVRKIPTAGFCAGLHASGPMPNSHPLAPISTAATPVSHYVSLVHWLRQPWPLWGRVVLVLGLYGVYFLLGGGLTGERMPYDAGHYWELAVSFQRQHQAFSLLYFNDPTRGYVAALLQFPALVVRFLTSCSMPTAAKTVGLIWAALLYAWLLPTLWHSLVPRRLAGGRWLILVLLSFVFWRDHFSFTLTDMPALALLLLALWAPSRAGIGWWLLAGLSLAAAFNSRPVYIVAALPVLGLAGWWNHGHSGSKELWRWVALALGVVVVLGPQLAINRLHFQRSTPLVLARVNPNDNAPLYLKQLTWGTRVLRYDTGLRERLIYADPSGLQILRQEGINGYASYSQFLSIVAHHPFNYGWRYLHHLFNGLDVQQPAPYLLRSYGVERYWMLLLNYTVLGLSVTVIVFAQRWLNWPRALALLALLLPCVVALPTAIECRFLLPLHLLLLTIAAFCASPRQYLSALGARPGIALVAVIVAGLWLGGCFWLSAATFRNLQPDRGKSLVDD